ncbi:hypothetical protein SODALDRAFT_10907 [Sodiomyces alkalinus F11]|uniref:Uncharacterized protein n=1 Tax=Sodiomyces alkalinus (strain CBS 110278 / VKM F-3762 / F11) TaxID=1314773 RepID=A0A3N2Q632_SODAK|nr:hypothetical protein SODALDRAFT_10907 [Sodiomyces alkalinus F11]ROT42243.1 hypothetical protein SODALDRAFT_10907 [Sodiomyces alkalinus F11]
MTFGLCSCGSSLNSRASGKERSEWLVFFLVRSVLQVLAIGTALHDWGRREEETQPSVGSDEDYMAFIFVLSCSFFFSFSFLFYLAIGVDVRESLAMERITRDDYLVSSQGKTVSARHRLGTAKTARLSAGGKSP